MFLTFKRFKYAVLRHMPGETGRHYGQKYEKLINRTIKFARALRRSKGKVCVDLGAHFGKYTRQMARKAEEVIAFEPDPWNFEKLQANVGSLDNVRLENAAVGVGDGLVPLYRDREYHLDPVTHSYATSTVATKMNLIEETAIEVRQVDFVRYLEELDEDIGVLKIDIEGAEVELLEALFDRPGLLERVDYIFVETHEAYIPGQEPRVKSLRDRARQLRHSRVDFDWQ